MVEQTHQKGALYRLAERVENILLRFSTWLNTPEDLEGVGTRIATMGAIFGVMILITLGTCFAIYGGMLGWRALFWN